MARKQTLQQIQDQIAALQQQAEAIREDEKAGVIDRIKEAVAFYRLTPADIFGGRKAKATPAKKTRKGAGQVKYRDEAGNTWTGFGKRPKWFLAALEAGKTEEDLRA